jgi:hypothetical protein
MPSIQLERATVSLPGSCTAMWTGADSRNAWNLPMPAGHSLPLRSVALLVSQPGYKSNDFFGSAGRILQFRNEDRVLRQERECISSPLIG